MIDTNSVRIVILGIVSGIGLLVLSSTKSHATADYHVRYPRATNIDACSGRLIEHMLEGGNVFHTYASYMQSCMNAPDHATWVLVSHSICGDPAKEKPCPRRNQSPAQLETWDKIKYSTNDQANIILGSASLGRNCTLRTNERGSSWFCESRRNLKRVDVRVEAPRFQVTVGPGVYNVWDREVPIPDGIGEVKGIYAIQSNTYSACNDAHKQREGDYIKIEDEKIFHHTTWYSYALRQEVSPGVTKFIMADPKLKPNEVWEFQLAVKALVQGGKTYERCRLKRQDTN